MRRLGEIVRKEDLVDSEYLTTLLVLVARWVAHVGKVNLVLILCVCCVCFLFFNFYKQTFVCMRFPLQGELPAMGEELRVPVGARGSTIQQVS